MCYYTTNVSRKAFKTHSTQTHHFQSFDNTMAFQGITHAFTYLWSILTSFGYLFPITL